jgi:hypothetical protein
MAWESEWVRLRRREERVHITTYLTHPSPHSHHHHHHHSHLHARYDEIAVGGQRYSGEELHCVFKRPRFVNDVTYLRNGTINRLYY